MSFKFLYIDAVYPYEWLAQKQAAVDVRGMNFTDYRKWVLSHRIYLSDYISSNIRKEGHECEELIVNDPVFILKLRSFLAAKPRRTIVKSRFNNLLKNILDVSLLDIYRMIMPPKEMVRDRVVQKMWEYYQPDIVLVREPTGISTYFWNRFKHRSIIAGLIGCNTAHPTNWLSHNFDVLFSLTDEYYRFFKSQGLPSFSFSYGVDHRLFEEISIINEKKYDIVFTGSLGDGVQANKTKLLEEIASHFNLSWWGPENIEADKFPFLFQSYKGRTSGMEMLKIYKQAKIVLNDYVNTANGQAVNLRLYEVLNVGSFLLTRNASNLKQLFPEGLLETFETSSDCMEKIRYYLDHPVERENKAAAATKWALENHGYDKKIKEMSDVLIAEFQKKISK